MAKVALFMDIVRFLTFFLIKNMSMVWCVCNL